MIAPIVHRGPDDAGAWTDASGRVGFGFRRLAILDLSPAGHQPMTSPSARFTMVFNGEVYNFGELRRELELQGTKFRGHSDTEVMLAAFEAWGIRASVERFVGMFAFAVWDERDRTLTLGRDRLGIKPLYVARAGNTLLFGSELKSLAAHPDFDRRINHDAVAAYLRYLYVPTPQTIYANAWKLPPGSLTVIADPTAPVPAAERYWDVRDVARRGVASPLDLSDTAATDALEELLREVVGLRLIADVPLGALLSGGIDSSTVVAIMQRLSRQPVQTFTIGFDDGRYDEAAHAAAVARHLGTAHTELRVTGQEALDVIPRLPQIYDEPHADPSQIPTYLVCGLARRSVTVALSGDGGDELFTGYNRYIHGERQIRRALTVPRVARRAVGRTVHALPVSAWDRAFGMLGGVFGGSSAVRFPGQKLHKMAHLLNEADVGSMYRSLMSASQDPVSSLVRTPSVADVTLDGMAQASDLPLMERMMLLDQATYLEGDLLAKVDRASMAVSLEARVPLLDHRLVAFSWRVPRHQRVRDGHGKWLLRQVLYRHVPPDLVDRPKMGFSVPIDAWLRGALRPWAEALLNEKAMREEGLLNGAAVRATWSDFLAGRNDAGLSLWAVLMLRAWSTEWRASA